MRIAQEVLLEFARKPPMLVVYVLPIPPASSLFPQLVWIQTVAGQSLPVGNHKFQVIIDSLALDLGVKAALSRDNLISEGDMINGLEALHLMRTTGLQHKVRLLDNSHQLGMALENHPCRRRLTHLALEFPRILTVAAAGACLLQL